jgi:lipocalin-like protein
MREDPSNGPLVGSWRLESWVALTDDGATESMPMGPGPEGLLVYAADGTMITTFGRADRDSFATGDVTGDLTGGSVEERSEAFRSFIAYGGRFAVDGSTVIHTVEVSLFPNWIGTTQRRRWEVDGRGEVLTLTSPPLTVGGQTRIQRLTWRRVRP